MTALVESMLSDADDALIRAAMAHLNLVRIHPFRDGNGRMARCLQSLILAADGVLAPVFMSVEEYLGRNTQAYYDVLAAVGGGGWNPGNDTRPWIRFMLTAHLRQARTLQRRVKATEQMWLELEKIVEQRHLPDRTIAALFDSASGLRVRRSTYAATLVEMGEGVSDQTATRDLQALVDSGLVIPFGEKRGRYYKGSAELRELRQRVLPRRVRDDGDPFAD